MRLTKFFKRMVAVSLAVVVAVTAIPYSSSVKAASDEYPEEIYFPIQVLDFPRDDLLFEWCSWESKFNLGLHTDYGYGGLGKGLVEDELGPDGTPVYKQWVVEKIAEVVQTNLNDNKDDGRGPVLNKKVDGVYHYLSLRKYVRADVPVLNWYTNRRLSEDTIWLSDDSSVTYRLENIDSANYNTWKDYGTGAGNYNEIYAEVYDDSVSSTKPIYILKRDAIVFFYNVSVSRTFTGLPANYSYKVNGFGQQNSNKTEVLVNGTKVSAGSVVTTNDSGELKVTIRPTATGVTELTDATNQKYGVWNISLSPVDTTYPLGNYAESKAKFDGNSSLGWTDIRTCMDYAYFVTKNYFKYNSSLNTQYSNYDNLIFHKVEDSKDGKVYYEFAADNTHVADKYQLIYNPVKKTIRNHNGVDANTAEGETKITSPGSMFIIDDAVKVYEDVDKKLYGETYYKTGNTYKTRSEAHNFHFTISSHSKFVYKHKKGQTFYFRGDDDVYVFVNGHLYLDLGGAHSPESGQINLDTIYAEHDDWITPDQPVSLDFFYMERHSTQSNFYAKLNFKLASDAVDFDMPYECIPYGYLVDLKYKFTTLRELNTNTNLTFTDNFGNIIGADGFSLADGIGLKDNTLEVTVTGEDGTVDSERSRTFSFGNPSSPTADEIAAVTNYFKNLELEQGDIVSIFGPQYDTSTKEFDEYETIDGESVNAALLNFVTNVTYDAYQYGATIPTKGSDKKNTPVRILTGSIKVCTAPVDNEKKDLADYGVFTIDRDTSLESDKSGTYHYENNPEAIGRTEETLDKLSRGKYTLRLDPTVLTSYKVMINDEEVTELTLDFEPTYDPDAKTWIYPDVKFELRAKRPIPDLKDLT